MRESREGAGAEGHLGPISSPYPYEFLFFPLSPFQTLHTLPKRSGYGRIFTSARSITIPKWILQCKKEESVRNIREIKILQK